MNPRIIFCLLILVTLVGVVSADTLITYAINDGSMNRNTDGTWSELRNGTGEVAVNKPATRIQSQITTHASTSGIYDQYWRAGMTFNTSTIGSASTISSAVVSVRGNFKSNTLASMNASLIDFTPSNKNGTLYVTGDYQATTFTRQANDIAYASWSNSAYNNWTVSNLAGINKTDVTTYMLAESGDVDNIEPTWGATKSSLFYYNDITVGGSTIEFMTISYTSGATPPVASFTCTKNFIRIPNSVTCTDTSTNTPTSWSWNMGDGSAAITTQNVTYQYPKRGLWSITLNATNAGGSNVTPSGTGVRVVGYEN